MPVFLYLEVLALHPDDNVDRVLKGFGSAESSFFGLVADDKDDALTDRLAERSDLVGIGKSKRVPGIEHTHRGADRLEVIDRIAERADFRRIDAPRINVGNRSNVAIHFFDLALADRHGGFVKGRHAKEIGRLPNAARPVDEDNRSRHGAALSKRRIPVRAD